MHDEIFSQLMSQTHKTLEEGGYPACALLVDSTGQIVTTGTGQIVSTHNPTAHAEIVCIEQLCGSIENAVLSGNILYTTLEPCLMCLCACYWAGIREVVYGVRKEKLPKENYEGMFDSTEIIKYFNEQISVVHLEKYEEEILQMLKEWEATKK